VLSTGSRGWENEFARDAITGSSIFLPLIAVLPLITANVLLKKRRWSNTFVLVSGVVWLLYSLLILAIAFHTYAEFKDVSFLLYALPCFALSIYSFWFVVRKRAV
jgi:putative effector of murein hydrolase